MVYGQICVRALSHPCKVGVPLLAISKENKALLCVIKWFLSNNTRWLKPVLLDVLYLELSLDLNVYKIMSS